MAHLLSGHLPNAAVLVAAGIVALAAERISAGPRDLLTRETRGIEPSAEIAAFMAPAGDGAGRASQRFEPEMRSDPFDPGDQSRTSVPVASGTRSPTVPATAARRRQLTAILIADDRRVAVIDESVVGVGSVLPDGARVAAISAERVSIVERNGQWRTLTLFTERR